MKKISIILLAAVALFNSCTDKFEEYNTDKKNPAVVSGEALFSNAELTLVGQVTNTDVNLNVWKLFAQYWTETTYTDESNYDIVNRTIADNTFQEYYSGNDATRTGGFLHDFKEAARLISNTTAATPELEAVKANKLAIIELLTAYAYQNLVDMFGNVPYSEALDIKNIAPKYDDAFTIYKDLLTKVDAALGNLDSDQAGFGEADLIYGGDIELWKIFGNSLKLKLGITLADVDPALSKSTVESAVAGGVFTSNADNALLHYLAATHVNPLYEDLVLSGRDDFVPANTVVDIMNGLNDPRRPFYFTTIGGIYKGGTYGASSPFAQYSHIADAIQEPTFPGILLTYDEVLFYMAEAAARGYNVGAPASQLYNEAITSSIEWWGGTPAEATAYLSQPSVVYNQAEWKQKIGTQAYIAFYTRGLEGFTEWRRLDFPTFNPPPGMTYSDIPKRYTYPINEQTLNKANYDAASASIGGDQLTTKLFWDVM